MRYVLPLVALFAGFATVVACSSDETPAPGGTSSSSSSSSGSTSSGSSSGGDDDDITKPGEDCSGVTALDCAQQAAHAKEANCKKFDETQFKKDCESQNCATPVQCASQQKAFGDCLLKEPVVCDGDDVSSDTPAACKEADKDVFTCLTGI